ncbi:MAG: hypothetical protein O2825_05335 [Proteobacteria bacterium]|nr:hypothetical protein [Pseudomonadota bacterium]MDA1070818.1 hypothetical protein [Pseudomonadota bacterium]
MSNIATVDALLEDDLADEALDRVGVAKGSGSYVMTGFPKQ